MQCNILNRSPMLGSESSQDFHPIVSTYFLIGSSRVVTLAIILCHILSQTEVTYTLTCPLYGPPRTICARTNKESKASAFSATPRERSQSRPTQGGKKQFSEQETKETQSGLKGPIAKEGQSTSPKNQEDLGNFESLNCFKELCNIEESL